MLWFSFLSSETEPQFLATAMMEITILRRRSSSYFMTGMSDFLTTYTHSHIHLLAHTGVKLYNYLSVTETGRRALMNRRQISGSQIPPLIATTLFHWR